MPFPATESLIAAAEVELGITFPNAWRRALMVRNGGEFEHDGECWTVAPVRDSTDRKHAIRTANHVGVETKAAREWASFPVDAVALAGNGAGDLLVALKHSESVWSWDHETGQLKELGDVSPLQD
jgi:cell wall assembly regulator SMI1